MNTLKLLFGIEKRKIQRAPHLIIIKFPVLQVASELLQPIPAPSAGIATEYGLPHRELRTCLYEGEGINLKEALRSGKTDQELKDIIISSIQHKPKDGWEAEKSNFTSSQIHQSMATIGG